MDDPVAAAAAVQRVMAREEAEAILSRLSPRQHAVLELVTEGLTNAQIAARLGTAETTVKRHVTLVLRKLGVRSRTQAALRAVRLLGHSAEEPGT